MDLIRYILIFTRVHDILPDNGADIVDEDEDIHAHDADRHGGTDALHTVTVESLAQGDGGQGEAGVGEDHGPPVEVEGLGGRADDGDNGDAEEPETQGPEEDAGGDGQQLDDAAIFQGVGVVEQLEVFGEAFAHADEGEGCEGGGSDADEHAWSVVAVGEAGLHQSADVVGVHHEADGEAEALEGDAGADDGEGCASGLLFTDDGGDGAAEHDGEGWKDP